MKTSCSPDHLTWQRPPGSHAAFSLIELLVVIAIISVLATMTVFGIQSMSVSRGVTQAASDLASLLELARNEAINKKTFVWVTVNDIANSGSSEVQMIAVYSADGSSSSAATNLLALTRVLRVKNCGLVDYSALSSPTRALFTNVSVSNVGSQGIIFTNLPSTAFNNRKSVTFTPQGEAMLLANPTAKTGFDPAMGVGFVPANKPAGSGNEAGVVLDGSTGAAKILRL